MRNCSARVRRTMVRPRRTAPCILYFGHQSYDMMPQPTNRGCCDRQIPSPLVAKKKPFCLDISTATTKTMSMILSSVYCSKSLTAVSTSITMLRVCLAAAYIAVRAHPLPQQRELLYTIYQYVRAADAAIHQVVYTSIVIFVRDFFPLKSQKGSYAPHFPTLGRVRKKSVGLRITCSGCCAKRLRRTPRFDLTAPCD